MKPRDGLSHVSVVVVTWRTPRLTESLIRHIRRVYSDVLIVVVECGPEEHDFTEIVPPPTVLRPGNVGYAGGNNVGFDHAIAFGARYVIVLNGDAFPLPGSIEALVSALDNGEHLAAVGAVLVRWDGAGRVEINRGTRFDWADGTTFPGDAEVIDFPCGAMVAYRADALAKVGGFDANLFLFYEEIDWSERARTKGYAVTTEEAARAVHLGSVSVRAAPRAAAYFHARNRLYVLRRYAGRHGHRVSIVREAARWPRGIARQLASGRPGAAWSYLAGQLAGFGSIPTVTSDAAAARRQQRWETACSP